MQFMQDQFNDFYIQSYGPVANQVSDQQKREIQMNFYTGAFAMMVGAPSATKNLDAVDATIFLNDISTEIKVWIENYIIERTAEKHNAREETPKCEV